MLLEAKNTRDGAERERDHRFHFSIYSFLESSRALSSFFVSVSFWLVVLDKGASLERKGGFK